MYGFIFRFCAMTILISFHCQALRAAERLALLIGNQNYKENVGRLKNPHNDIVAVGASLKQLDFKIKEIRDGNYRTIDTAIKKHIAEVNAAGADTLSFIYYSGHGAANVDTRINYLIPIDVDSAEDDSLWTNSIELTDIIDKLSRQAPRATHYVVFDACRNELQLTKKDSKALGDEKGFVPMVQTGGVLIAYATAPQRTASDAGGDSGPYARALAEELSKPGIEAVTMFRNVQLRVKDAIGQDPWLTFPTLPAVYFAGQQIAAAPPASPTVNLEDSQDPEELAVFIKRMPQGPYRKSLEERLIALRNKTPRTCPGGRTWPPSSISIGAVEIPTTRMPWAGALWSKTKKRRYCSATVIAPFWAVTAAHCVGGVLWDELGKSGDLKVVIGGSDLSTIKEENTFDIDQRILHESFTSEGGIRHDIALLKLGRPWSGPVAQLSSRLGQDPTGLDEANATASMLGVVAGYGFSVVDSMARLSENDMTSDMWQGRLREVIVPFVQQARCKARYSSIDDSNICAGFENGGADACQAFSGAPLTALTEDGCPYAVGLVSWGGECGEPQQYGVYTRLSHYKDWLQSRVPEIKFLGQGDAKINFNASPLPQAWKGVLGIPPQ